MDCVHGARETERSQRPVGVAGGILACVEQAVRTDGLVQTRPSLAVCNNTTIDASIAALRLMSSLIIRAVKSSIISQRWEGFGC